ncbi:MAG: glycosyltransferase family 4 protein [bacterium]
MIKVCHITTVHKPFDTRIFYKECISLAKKGYQVSLIAQHKTDEVIHNIRILHIPFAGNRIKRMLSLSRYVLQRAIEVDAQVYHFHDPELIPIGLKLKRLGKKVIYDVHEDYFASILEKKYIPKYLRWIVAVGFELYEKIVCRNFDYVIAATPHIKKRFEGKAKRIIDIQNMPLPDEFENVHIDWTNKEKGICYVGGISRSRGLDTILNLASMLERSHDEMKNVKVYLAGEFLDGKLIEITKNFRNIVYLGFLDRNGIAELFNRCIAGLVFFHPEPNNVNSMPTKMFEYMSWGIPVIASDFPLWKEIVENIGCGFCVNPFDTEKIYQIVKFLVSNIDKAREMGIKGRQAVIQKYNWSVEERKLLKIYDDLLN